MATVRDSRGNSVLELLIGLALLILIVGSTYEFMIAGQKAASKTRDSFVAQGQLRSGVDSITDEIRWADLVTAASATSVTVRIPQNTPFSITSPYSVTYTYNSAARTLNRQQGSGPVQPVAYNVVQLDGSSGLSFNYYDASGVSLGQSPTTSLVARVRLTVITTSNRTSRTLTGDAALRSR